MAVPMGEIGWTALEQVVYGCPAATAVADLAQRREASRVFLLASQFLDSETDEIEKIRRALGGRYAASHRGVRPHVPKSDVLTATAQAREAGADLIVTIGGGSVTDAGKIAALCLKHDIRDLEHLDRFKVTYDDNGRMDDPTFAGPDVRVVAVPTTLSGGEFNPLAGATDEKLRKKHGFSHRQMAPVAVVFDPALTVHTPEWLWLSTGVRALDHAVETLSSFHSNDFFDGIADSALRLLADALPRVKADPEDLDARLRCQIGAWQSMIPMVGGVPMGASHAIGHMLGAICGVPHGHTSCVMTPYVQQWNAEVDSARQKRISACLGNEDMATSELLDRLIRGLGMPRTLDEVGVREDQLQQIAEYTLTDLWGKTNARPIENADQVMEILRAAMYGATSAESTRAEDSRSRTKEQVHE